MTYDQNLYERLSECGLTLQDVGQIPKQMQVKLMDGHVTAVVVNKACQKCGQPHGLWIGFVEPKHLPPALRLLLTRSTAWRTKKT
jgi:hypothetical protein